jgi:hypothetical protein
MTVYSYSTYQAPTEENQATTRNEDGGSNGGTTSVTISGDSITTNHSSNASIRGDQLSAYAQDDWRSTAMKPNRMRTDTIEADTIVKIGTMQARVADFVSAGILQRNPDGTFTEGSEAPQERQQSQSNPDEASMPAEVAATVDKALEVFNDATLDASMSLAISSVAGEVDFESVVRKAAKGSGLEPADAAQRIQFTIVNSDLKLIQFS